MEKFIKKTSNLMEKSINLLTLNFNQIRTHKINPEILYKITINYNGKKTKLKKISNIYIENSHTLIINPWDYKFINEIKNTIFIKLEINPIIKNNNIKLIFPNLTEETRKKYIKKARLYAEKSKIYIRNIRRDIKNNIKKKLKNKIYNINEAKNLEKTLQKLTDKYINFIKNILKKKEKELIKI
ncbi:Ribosome recycling factor [Candidatus Portiera aleyrodidarum]|uniref:ribosome recycling factor n=1 Tax=Candidatus Portiera aleyrodidarum TaxID=91844 RepID=UPI0005D8588F|nr:ribosome recycling factor [Candidatus Portiera aleyrodidarum]CEL12283.1 Ribosome recycling factor [Candidatus Portiera aleyrodidarum]